MSLDERSGRPGGAGGSARLPEGHRDAPGDGAEGAPVGLGPLGWARWTWRQLTSMRTALFLLLLLAVAAVPGSLVPQRDADPVAAAEHRREHPALGPWLERLGVYDVYSSPWFSAIYLLLFISLVGCVLPRTRHHARALRAAPPRTPARFERLPEHRRAEVAAEPEAVLAAARSVLRARRYRLADHPGSLAAQRGELRESGNLLFHLSLVGVLVAVAAGGLYGYRGQAVVPEGRAFANSLAAYDSFDPGTWYDPDDLPPFRFVLDGLRVRFEESAGGNQFGAPRDFSATVRITDEPGAAPRTEQLRVNEPLRVGGASVYLAGNGYAPRITVRDATGEVAFSGQVPFLPQDANYSSTGVVKVADAVPEQIGVQAQLLPTAVFDPERGPVSTFPDARNPVLVLTAYAGDLGVDAGVAQNVYTLDTSRMTQLSTADGAPFSAALAPGEGVQLPDGRGSITFDALDRYAGVTIRSDPARGAALVFSLLAIAGLTASLFVPRRRVWVRAGAPAPGAQGTLLEVGALARSEDPGLAAEADAVLEAVLEGVRRAVDQQQVHDDAGRSRT
ncbi:cytochrome c biogenesis protein ResB [Quadrisphaera sp. DSM 44207]|uniref:cytochrome c biogenesis protein ResB n=1 Tax=Quadrisphaera sp. DSM 44207 TaxID=1881057 RepID=UPI0008866630|nr:cytochrome c biogenesis protein ResB [Quadrisphaera sp. DSM 44207]SDQ15893.1 cytochrome c biogenesis protein [Quadrisphaera sp. DSM 44207]